MNHELYKNMITNRNKINELYRVFWIYTLNQYKEMSKETGLYFWLHKDNNDYVIFHHGVKGLIEQRVKMNEEEKEIVIKRLTDDGFNASETDNKNILLTISKKALLDFIKNKQEEKSISTKILTTPFAENRKRK